MKYLGNVVRLGIDGTIEFVPLEENRPKDFFFLGGVFRVRGQTVLSLRPQRPCQPEMGLSAEIPVGEPLGNPGALRAATSTNAVGFSCSQCLLPFPS